MAGQKKRDFTVGPKQASRQPEKKALNTGLKTGRLADEYELCFAFS
jgi:hypothetical protein